MDEKPRKATSSDPGIFDLHLVGRCLRREHPGMTGPMSMAPHE